MKSNKFSTIEWPTLLLILGCYGVWLAALWLMPLPLGVIVAGVAIALHSSLQHEAIHGHPFGAQWMNDLLVWPPLTLVIPYSRFAATHRAHHHDEVITDPYDDPESNYLDPAVWGRLPRAVQVVLGWNNTLAGRLLLGPLVGTASFLICEWRQDSVEIRRTWMLHVPVMMAVLALVAVSPMPVWAYLLAAYLGLSLLKLRTFLEHQAHVRASGRSVIIEDRGPLAFLFLNNNLHVVHHMHPTVPWYALPALYRSRKDHYLRRNGGYLFRSYGQIFRQYLWRAKDPVPHPLWPR
ncbi:MULTISPECIES: fatty acid desaturase [unclassified Yoonia]|uniref:fatty acid desaturase n=1 Tax=unclassified Yoonia TaxID=2629118 RepID=UPI002AFDECD7|nr:MULTISPECIES: fatty acid desaturase [unclassified Yoonia]